MWYYIFEKCYMVRNYFNENSQIHKSFNQPKYVKDIIQTKKVNKHLPCSHPGKPGYAYDEWLQKMCGEYISI
jgi:hypothetical protein